ncbi:MAG TPA: DUF11 domain-containing protein [Methanosarcinaceae archaeon]|nr:DUF11 domain-containing protein [Methanosarcinaceae archaeon]
MFKKSIFLLLTIFFIFSTQALAYTTDDIEWKTSVDSTSLGWGDSVTNGDYVIKAEDFTTDEYVYIKIFKDGLEKQHAPLGAGGTLIDDDEIKVYVISVDPDIDPWTDSMVNPTASIIISRRGLPSFEITIETDESTYDPKDLSSPSKVTATITVKNNGHAEAKNVDLTINTGDLILNDGDLTHNYYSIEKGETTSPVTITMDVPLLWDKTSFSISANAKGYDIKGAEHTKTASKSVTIENKWKLIAIKTVTEEIYMTDTAYVLVSIRNAGICTLNSITVTDSVVDGLELKDSVTLKKTISLKAGESTEELFEYSLKPLKPGSYTSPASVAEFTASNRKKYSVSSGTPATKVNGPYITLTKSVSSSNVTPGDEITVTVKVDNTGNRDASVTASDSLPSDVPLVSGDTGFQEVIKKSSSKSYSYVIRMDAAGDVKLPSATASFIDLEGYKGEKISNMPVISVVEPVTETEPATDGTGDTQPTSSEPAQTENDNNGQSTATSLPVEEQKEPGFEALLSGLALASVYILFKRKN